MDDLNKIKDKIIKLIDTGEAYDEIEISKGASLSEIRNIILELGFREIGHDVDGFSQWRYFTRDNFNSNQLVLHTYIDSGQYKLYIEDTM